MIGSLPYETESHEPLPGVIQGYVSVRSKGKTSPFGGLEKFPETSEPFQATQSDRKTARQAVKSMGLSVLAESRLGMAVAGPAEAYEELSGGKLVTRERLLHAEAGRRRYVTHIDIVGSKQPETLCLGRAKSKTTRIEGFFLERPLMLHGIFPSPIPPLSDRFYLRVPDDIAVGLGATRAHRQGQVGEGVTVAMVDSGQYPHPYFTVHDYDVRPTVAVVPNTSPTEDPVGHGTGESANIFAVAPGATLQPYRASNNQGNLVAAIAAFLAAKAASPQILTNSWGGDGPFPPFGPPDQFEVA
ncbi:MAG: peptidase S8, partial [Acidobacteriota bacterium]